MDPVPGSLLSLLCEVAQVLGGGNKEVSSERSSCITIKVIINQFIPQDCSIFESGGRGGGGGAGQKNNSKCIEREGA